MLHGLASNNLTVRLLTAERNLKPDFLAEVAAFRKQFAHIKLEVRSTTDFHDRFIVIDGSDLYHVGASIKDAGKRAFMISRIEDESNLSNLKRSVDEAWSRGKVL